jgi:predicted acyltransferase
MAAELKLDQEQDRILSIDFFRGFTMFMLVTGITGVIQILAESYPSNSIIEGINRQLEHAEWSGLFAWDLIQPFFMFIVGVSMPFAVMKRMQKGDSWNRVFLHVLKRSLILLAFGFMLGSDKGGWSLTNVLAQLSFTYMIAFLLMKFDFKWQLAVSFLLIIFTDIIYRMWSVPGFDQPFTADHNFGSWVDITITGRLAHDRWVAFNAIPTSAHTIWGVLVGKLLMKDFTPKKKLTILWSVGVLAIVAGYVMAPYIPIIKRTCTSSFMFVSGGYALVAMSISFWLIDVLKYRKAAMFFAIVGMNPIFIYLFSNLGGKHLLNGIAEPFTSRLFGWGGDVLINEVTTIAVAAMVWYICYFLYKRKIFIKI